MNLAKFWYQKLSNYATKAWAKKPSIFAEFALKFFPQKGKVLELGAGFGEDSLFFAKQGYDVVATDFFDEALERIKKSVPQTLKDRLIVQHLDLEEKFPYNENSFEVVYSHQSIHYFNQKITEQIFSEIYRILKPGGVIAILVNSTSDPEYGTGTKLETDLYNPEGNIAKRYFSIDSMKKFAKKFRILQLDNNGERYQDNAIGVCNLIRFIGKKDSR